jgi:hypothetical protein
VAGSRAPYPDDDARLRVALVRMSSAYGQSLADELVAHLRFNGMSVAENGDAFLDLPFPEGQDATDAVAAARVTADLARAAPDVVLVASPTTVADGLVAPLERAWPAGAPHRPSYLFVQAPFDDALRRFVGRDAERRRRFFALDVPITTAENARFTMHYNEVFQTKLGMSESPSSPYEAFYLVAYAAALAGPGAVTGSALAAGLGRLGSGTPIAIGPSSIYDVAAALREQGQVGLVGIEAPLRFDPKTGDAVVAMSIACMGADRAGQAGPTTDCGLTYAQGELRGALRLPR